MRRDKNDTVVVLTALDLECRAVLDRLIDIRPYEHRMGTIFQVGRLRNQAGQVAVAITGAGNQAAAILAERAISTFAPRALFFVGVAGALHHDLALDDVVIGTKIYFYHGGLDETDGFRARPQAWEAPHELDQLARHLGQHDLLTRHIDVRPDGTRPAVWFRPIAAGEVVLNSRETPLAMQLKHTYNDAAAIEMESAGTAKAAHLNRRLPMLTVRGISDKADGQKWHADEAGFQPVAASAASAVAMTLIAEILDRAAPVPDYDRQSASSYKHDVIAGGGNVSSVFNSNMHVYSDPSLASPRLDPGIMSMMAGRQVL